MVLAQILASALAVTPSAPPPLLVSALAPCTANQLSYGFDAEGGRFDGMSQSGTLLVVRNLGPGPCRMGALPQLQFQDGAGRTLATARSVPRGMHPGPVILPVALAPEAEATAQLHWVQGDVYDGHNCVAPTRVRFGSETGSSSAPFMGRLCGPAGKPVPYDQPPLKTDPTLSVRP